MNKVRVLKRKILKCHFEVAATKKDSKIKIANGVPWSAQYIDCLGDLIADLKRRPGSRAKGACHLRISYELIDDPCVKDML